MTDYCLMKMADRPAYVIGSIVKETENHLVVYYPVVLSLYNTPDGMEVITSKYLPFSETDEVMFMKSSIHAVTRPKQSFINHYLKFIKEWRDEGGEKDLENRILGIVSESNEDELDDEEPEQGTTIH